MKTAEESTHSRLRFLHSLVFRGRREQDQLYAVNGDMIESRHYSYICLGCSECSDNDLSNKYHRDILEKILLLIIHWIKLLTDVFCQIALKKPPAFEPSMIHEWNWFAVSPMIQSTTIWRTSRFAQWLHVGFFNKFWLNSIKLSVHKWTDSQNNSVEYQMNVLIYSITCNMRHFRNFFVVMYYSIFCNNGHKVRR